MPDSEINMYGLKSPSTVFQFFSSSHHSSSPLIPTLFSHSTLPANRFPLLYLNTAGLAAAIQSQLMDSLYEEATQNVHSLSSLPYHHSFDLFLALLLAFALYCLLGTSHSPILCSSSKFVAGLVGVSPQLQWHYSDLDRLVFWPTELSRQVFYLIFDF